MTPPLDPGPRHHRWVTVRAGAVPPPGSGGTAAATPSGGPPTTPETLRLAVTEVGPSDAPAWVVAHGVGSSARFLLSTLAGPLVAAGRRLVVYDARGHGASDPARTVAAHHLDVLAADLAAVTGSVTGDVEVVGGVSLGGHTAVRAVTGGQVVPSRAVLACLPAWTGRATPGEGPHAAISAEVRRDGVAGMLARLAYEPGLRDWLRTALLTDHPRHDPASLAAALQALDGGEAPELAEVARLTVPLGLVAWPDDPGHPLAVAHDWGSAAPVAALERIELSALDVGLEVFGHAMLRAVVAATAAGRAVAR